MPRKTTGYPKYVAINTPDGAGEATKASMGEAWHVATPTRQFRFYGSAAQMKAETRKLLAADYDRFAFETVTIGL